jgi:hypothetical protein
MIGEDRISGVFIMADREQSQTSKRGMDERPQRDIADKGHPTSGSKGEERQHGVRDMGSVGRDAPDQSKERNTEIAVEAGHKGPGEHRGEKR